MSSSVLKKDTIDLKLSTERSVCSLHLPTIRGLGSAFSKIIYTR